MSRAFTKNEELPSIPAADRPIMWPFISKLCNGPTKHNSPYQHFALTDILTFIELHVRSLSQRESSSLLGCLNCSTGFDCWLLSCQTAGWSISMATVESFSGTLVAPFCNEMKAWTSCCEEHKSPWMAQNVDLSKKQTRIKIGREKWDHLHKWKYGF